MAHCLKCMLCGLCLNQVGVSGHMVYVPWRATAKKVWLASPQKVSFVQILLHNREKNILVSAEAPS